MGPLIVGVYVLVAIASGAYAENAGISFLEGFAVVTAQTYGAVLWLPLLIMLFSAFSRLIVGLGNAAEAAIKQGLTK